MTSIKKDYLISTFAFGFRTVGNLLFYFILGKYMDEMYFEEVTLVKRIGGALLVFMLLGLGVSLSRQVALIKEKESIEIYRFFLAAIIIVSGVGLLFIGSCNVFNSFFTDIFFNTARYQNLILPLTLIVVIQLYSGIVTALLRGQLKVFESSILTVFRTVSPILALWIGNNAIEYFYITAFLILLSTITVFLYTAQRSICLKAAKEARFGTEIKTLLSIGIPRMPGDFALEAMLTLPVLITAHTTGSWEASMLSFSLTIITMSVALLSPISFILLPYSAKFIKDGKKNEIKYHIGKLLKGALVAVGLVSVGVYFGAEIISSMFLKSSNTELATFFLKIVVWACIPYSIYIILRSFIDAAYKQAINALNIVIGLASSMIVTGIAYYFFSDVLYPVVPGIIIGYSVTAILTLNSYYKFFKMKAK